MPEVRGVPAPPITQMMNDQTFARSRLSGVLADLPSGSATVEYVGEGLRKRGRDDAVAWGEAWLRANGL